MKRFLKKSNRFIIAGLSFCILSWSLITPKAQAVTAMEYGLIAAATVTVVTTGSMPSDLTISYSDPATGREVKVPLSKCQSKRKLPRQPDNTEVELFVSSFSL